MPAGKVLTSVINKTSYTIPSIYLERDVIIDIYLPKIYLSMVQDLILINDGQDLPRMDFMSILEPLISKKEIKPIIFVGIHCGPERKMEYGMKDQPDFKGRGAKAGLYEQFLFEECIPFLHANVDLSPQLQMHYAGFSLGALSAFDISWRHADLFSTIGIFSGSLWWRKKGYDEGYNDETDRLAHAMIRSGRKKNNLKFFVQCGAADESEDRNKNGIIDSIDDAIDLVKELKQIGYTDQQIYYMEIADGKHDVPTWGRAFPYFLKWGWPNKKAPNQEPLSNICK